MTQHGGGGEHTIKGQGSKAKQGSDTREQKSEGLELLPARGAEANYSLLNTQIFSL